MAYRAPSGYQEEQTVAHFPAVGPCGLPGVSLWSPCGLPVVSLWSPVARLGLAWLGFDCLGSVAVGSMGFSVASVQICLASIWGLAPVSCVFQIKVISIFLFI